jgi:hypothetical protein
MNYGEFITQQVKSIMASIKSNQALYAIHLNEDDKETLNNSFRAFSSLCGALQDYCMKHEVDVTRSDLRVYTKSQHIPDTEYFCLSAHVNIGYSPFMMYNVKGENKGVFIKLLQHRFAYCSKAIKNLTQTYFEDQFKKDDPVTMKMAKAHIRERLKDGNLDEVPLIEKTSPITFYLDFEHRRIMAKSGHRDQDGLAAFFELVRRLNEAAEQDEFKPAALPSELALKYRFSVSPFTTYAMSAGKAYGAYNLSKMVEFYSASEVSEDKSTCAVEPTWSGSFSSTNDTSQVITFKNSIGLFLPDVDSANPPPTTFTMINNFTDEKSLSVNTLKVNGEIPIGDLLTSFRTEYPEQADEALNGEFIDIRFSTQAKDGNICIQVTDDLQYHKEAAVRFLRDDFSENHYAMKQVEGVLLGRLGDLLCTLHDSIDLFVSVYMESNPLPTSFSDESTILKALQA